MKKILEKKKKEKEDIKENKKKIEREGDGNVLKMKRKEGIDRYIEN